jgi:hypothetical protein
MFAIDHALAIWHKALSSPLGLCVRTRDPRLAKTLLYRARANSGIPQLNGISVRTSPTRPSSDLWLIRDRDAEANAAASSYAPDDLDLGDLLPSGA